MVADLSSRANSLGGTTYASTIYRAAGALDTNIYYPVATLPVAAVGFSK